MQLGCAATAHFFLELPPRPAPTLRPMMRMLLNFVQNTLPVVREDGRPTDEYDDSAPAICLTLIGISLICHGQTRSTVAVNRRFRLDHP